MKQGIFRRQKIFMNTQVKFVGRKSCYIDYENRITLNLLKNLICPNETQLHFVNKLFEPLRKSGCISFSESYSCARENKLSTFMNGNIYTYRKTGYKIRQSVSTLREWADLLSDKKIYLQITENTDSYIGNYKQLKDKILQLCEYESDRQEMPAKFCRYIDCSFREEKCTEAVLMLVLWSLYGKDQIHLLNFIFSGIPEKSTAVLEPHIVSPKDIFEGREDVLKLIDEKISDRHCVFLQGMSGIGKTECAKQFAVRHREKYDTVIFAEYNSNFTDLFTDNSIFMITPPFISERLPDGNGGYESTEEFYRRKLIQFRYCVNERTLVIIDNADCYDEKLLDFCKMPCDIIVTTRYAFNEDYPDQTIIVDRIASVSECRKIFSAHYSAAAEADVYTEKIIDYFSGHPMAIELAARQMKASRISPENMYKLLENNMVGSLKEGFSTFRNIKEETMTGHILKIFNTAGLNEEEIYVLKCLYLLPKKGMNTEDFKRLCGLESYNPINSLIRKSWVTELDGVVSVHTLVKETVGTVFRPDIRNCGEFIKNITGDFTHDFFYFDIAGKEYIYEYVYHLYLLFPEPSIDLQDFYEWMELIFSNADRNDKALEISSKLYKLYLSEYGENNFRTARMLCRTGCDEKYRNFDKSLKIIEKSLGIIKSLENQDSYTLLYISDIYIVMTDTYITCYQQSHDEKYISGFEFLNREIIRIRRQIADKYDYTQVNCVSAYCGLAQVSVIRKEYQEAEMYIARAEEEYARTGLESLRYYIDYVRAELFESQNMFDDAIESLTAALNNRRHFYRSELNTKTVNLEIFLGKLYEQAGYKGLAEKQYTGVTEIIEKVPCYSGMVSLLNERIEKIRSE